MRVRVSQPTLLSLCRAAKGFATAKSTIAELRGLRLECFEDAEGGCIVVSGTDLRAGLRIWGAAVVEELGVVVVDAEAFTEFVSHLDNLAVIDLVVERNRLVATARQAKASFALLDLSRYPDGPDDRGDAMLTATAGELASMLNHAVRFAS